MGFFHMILFVHVHNLSTCFMLFIFLLFFFFACKVSSQIMQHLGINMLLLCSIVIFLILKIISRLCIKKQTLSSEVPQIEISKVRLIVLGVIFATEKIAFCYWLFLYSRSRKFEINDEKIH